MVQTPQLKAEKRPYLRWKKGQRCSEQLNRLTDHLWAKGSYGQGEGREKDDYTGKPALGRRIPIEFGFENQKG